MSFLDLEPTDPTPDYEFVLGTSGLKNALKLAV